eukprot:1253152-Pleurochrysis_carterae.AAC.1
MTQQSTDGFGEQHIITAISFLVASASEPLGISDKLRMTTGDAFTRSHVRHSILQSSLFKG